MIRTAVLFAAFALVSTPFLARAEGAAAPAAAKAGTRKKATKSPAKVGAKAGRKGRNDSAGDGQTKSARVLRPGALQVTADRMIGDGQVTPFPSHAGAARKAFDQYRRDQLDDAEQAARAQPLDDRWQTVLFHLRSLDSSNDSEACFWRALAFYRLGDLPRARRIREICELSQNDADRLDQEDAHAGSIQPVQVLSAFVEAGEKPAEIVMNPMPYIGPAPLKK
jgi:hypothetical protein